MALLGLDGNAYYTTTTMAQRFAVASTPIIDPTGGNFNSVHRNGKVYSNGNSDESKYITTNTDATFIWQGHVRKFLYGPILAGGEVLVFENDSDAIEHLELDFWSDGSIECNRGATSLGRTIGNVHHIERWNYLEFKCLISDTVGTIDLRVNGRDVLNLTGADTRNGGTDEWVDTVSYRRGSEDQFEVSNAIFMNGAGSIFNDFIGQRRIYTLFPNANDSVAWTRSSTSSTNWELVDEFDPDGDTTYVESASTGDIDMYAFTDLSTTATLVDAIAVNISARETATTVGTNMRVRVDSTGSVDLGATITLSSVYSIYQTVFSTNPAGGSWNTGDVDSILVGIEVVA